MMVSSPPPRVIHLKTGNMKIDAFHRFLNQNWSIIIEDIEKYKLINVYNDRIESFE